jgi:hypothetical protein
MCDGLKHVVMGRLPDQPSNGNVQNPDIRIGCLSLFLQDFLHTTDGFANVVLELIDSLALRIAARKRWDLAPKAALGIFVDDNRECLHI